MPKPQIKLNVQSLIFEIRNHRVMIDADLARIYGTSTKRLNEQVKRNRNRFPEDFMFQLNEKEKFELVAKCDQFKNLKHSSSLPNAFTEHGALMLANVLSSSIAIEASIEVVRSFVRLRVFVISNQELNNKFDQIEQRFSNHDSRLKEVFEAVRQIMTPSQLPRKKPIGFSHGK